MMHSENDNGLASRLSQRVVLMEEQLELETYTITRFLSKEWGKGILELINSVWLQFGLYLGENIINLY